MDASENRSYFVNLPGHLGRTPLHVAVLAKDAPCLQVLLSVEGINLNAIDDNKQTPLHLACGESQSEECGKFILFF